MAVFPELIPSTRTYSPGEFPHSVHGVYDGSQARVRHSNTVLGVRLRMFFPAITTAQLLTVIAHYQGQRGRFLPFVIPYDLLSGTDVPADFTPAGHQWRYAAKPTVEDISVDDSSPTNLHNLTVELETVPPENTIVSGARLRVRTSLRAGSAQLGEFFDVYATFAPGSAFAQLEFLTPVTFEPGSPFPVVTLDVTATLEAGAVIPDETGALTVFAMLAAGAASGAATDPNFADVSLLLKMDGTNGSTTFTDLSSYGHTVTAVGNAQVSTAESVFGGASLLIDGTGDHLSVPDHVAFDFGTGDFTIEARIRYNTGANSSIVTGVSTGALFFGVGVVGLSPSPHGFATGRANVAFDNLSGAIPANNTWYAVAVTRSGSDLRIFVDGVQQGSTFADTRSYDLSAGGLRIGESTNGYIDELRVTKGVARYTANYTVSGDPFPTS